MVDNVVPVLENLDLKDNKKVCGKISLQQSRDE